jgi:hypothetical protein
LLQKNIRCKNEKIFFHPDCTVGAGITPAQFEVPAPKNRKRKVAGYTAGRELPKSWTHPTLKTSDYRLLCLLLLVKGNAAPASNSQFAAEIAA